MHRDVVVVGGGLAGISAALDLVDGGCSVTLLESRARLGGAAISFQRGELSIDNGQHVFLRCCDAYLGLLTRLGVADRVTLQRHLDIAILRADGRQARLRRTPGVPAPLHLTASLAGFGLLGWTDRLRVGRAALALRLLNPANPALDQRTLGDFLRQHGQTDAIIRALWGIVATATLNLAPDEASLALAAKVFRTGMLDHAAAADIGYAAVPLGDLHSVATRAALEAAGVDVRLNHRVTCIATGEATGGGCRVIARTRGDVERTWSSDAVILATPHREAFTALPQLASSPARGAADLGATPILNVHVIYDRQVTDLPFAAAVDSPVQWFFDRSDTSGLRRTKPAAQYLAVTVSAADDVIDRPAAEVTAQYVAELARLLPGASRAEVLDTFVTRERRATFRQSAGSAALRPAAGSGVAGVWLAGAWTATGWPDTMESAVRSGHAAAAGVLEHDRDPAVISRSGSDGKVAV
jgi:squalene-associated FAD-dependent desaturase